MSLYLIILLLSLFFPLILSFDKKVHYYTHWRYLFPAIIGSAVLFIIVDSIFTRNGIWGFNPRYINGFHLYGLPVEESLFFIIIPFSSIFIHFVIREWFPKAILSDKTTGIISISLVVFLILVIALTPGRTYTFVYSLFAAILILLSFSSKERLLNRLYVTFPVMLIPFFVVNGILTGSFIEEEVVWYNPEKVSGVKIFTIPAEDIVYGFSLIALNLKILYSLKPDNYKENPE